MPASRADGRVVPCRYGVAVTIVFFTTTNLFFLASMVVYNLNPLYTWPVYAFFLLVDGAYLSANLFKFLTGESPCSLPCHYHTGLPVRYQYVCMFV